ncbi:unnamed protein product [Ceratitis capitata]|uniref:(Mediterranean fruit fly) hypothetical protein n=1 Tax=Ceratitis capitata TaxID=7213 RepID=A0A811USM0_CERCA|nr:unnamed protein product [Ceratitis capitata]
MELLQRNRAWAKLPIDRAYKAAKQTTEAPTKEAAYNDFMRCSQKLYAYSGEENFVDPIEDIEQTEEKHFQTHSLLHAQIADLPGSSQATAFREDDPIDRLAVQQASFLETFAARHKGDALASTQHIRVADENYEQAWDRFSSGTTANR